MIILPIYFPAKRAHTNKIHLAIWNCGIRPQSFIQAIKDTRITIRKGGEPIIVLKKGAI